MGDTVLIILNQPLCSKKDSIFYKLWNMSFIRVCADGGANRLFDLSNSNNNNDDDDEFVPDLIVGDLDSLRDDVRVSKKLDNTYLLRFQYQIYHHLHNIIGLLFK